MSLKKFIPMVIAAMALSALWASSASATIGTERAEFYTNPGSVTLPETTSTTADAEVVDHTETGKQFTLLGKIGVAPNQVEVHLIATGLECVGCVAQNKAVTSKAGAVAFGSGQLRFTGITGTNGCTVKDGSSTGTPGQVTTKPLFLHADFMHEGKAFVQFIPQTAGGPFATVYLHEGACKALAGPYNVTGTVFGEAKNATGVFSSQQEIEVSPAIQKTTGAELKLGGNLAELTGTAGFSLTKTAGEKVEFAVKP
jgi:hypothetical protein